MQHLDFLEARFLYHVVYKSYSKILEIFAALIKDLIVEPARHCDGCPCGFMLIALGIYSLGAASILFLLSLIFLVLTAAYLLLHTAIFIIHLLSFIFNSLKLTLSVLFLPCVFLYSKITNQPTLLQKYLDLLTTVYHTLLDNSIAFLKDISLFMLLSAQPIELIYRFLIDTWVEAINIEENHLIEIQLSTIEQMFFVLNFNHHQPHNLNLEDNNIELINN